MELDMETYSFEEIQKIREDERKFGYETGLRDGISQAIFSVLSARGGIDLNSIFEKQMQLTFPKEEVVNAS